MSTKQVHVPFAEFRKTSFSSLYSTFAKDNYIKFFIFVISFPLAAWSLTQQWANEYFLNSVNNETI